MSGNLLAPLQLDCAMWSLCSHPCFRTPRGNPAQLGHNHILAIDAIQSNRQNHLGLRWIWWFLLCNFRPVSHLYLQLDTSGNPPLMSPVSKRTRFFHIVSSNFPRYYRSALWNNWMEQCSIGIQCSIGTLSDGNTSSSDINICPQTNCICSRWWKMQCCIARVWNLGKPKITSNFDRNSGHAAFQVLELKYFGNWVKEW